MWGYFAGNRPVTDLTSAAASDLALWKRWTTRLLSHGVYVAPSPFEAAFFSAAHGPREIAATWRAAEAG